MYILSSGLTIIPKYKFEDLIWPHGSDRDSYMKVLTNDAIISLLDNEKSKVVGSIGTGVAFGTEDAIIILNSFELEIKESHDNLTQKCVISVPKKLMNKITPISYDSSYVGPPVINSIYNIGDYVHINYQYVGITASEGVFDGYITDIQYNTPVTITVEDNMHILHRKQIRFPVTKKTTDPLSGEVIPPNWQTGSQMVSLKQIIDILLEDTGLLSNIQFKIDKFGILRFDNSARECLDKIREKFGIFFYFQDGILNVTGRYDASHTPQINIELEREVEDYSKLVYKTEDEMKISLKVTSIDPVTGKRHTIVMGTNKENKYYGSHREVFYAGKLNKSDLEKVGTQKLKDMLYIGYEGSFTTFGHKMIRPGDSINLTSTKYPERNGAYLVNTVFRTFGNGGYRQEVTLGPFLTNPGKIGPGYELSPNIKSYPTDESSDDISNEY
jgi:hypothetical protein